MKKFYKCLFFIVSNIELNAVNILGDKMIELSKEIKIIVDDMSRYADWATRDDIKQNCKLIRLCF